MIHRDVSILLFQRGWQTLSGVIIVLLIPLTLTASEQGLFFTFLSFVAIQSFFDAGITVAFFNYVAHERARLTAEPPLDDAERLCSEARLLRLVEMSHRWYLALAILFAVLIGSFGYYFLEITARREGLCLHWQAPFFVLIGAISLSLYNLSRIPILEGHGMITDVAYFRLRSNILSAVILWVFLAMGGGLWALAISYTAQSTAMTVQITYAYRQLPLHSFTTPSNSNPGTTVNWRTEMLPLQFRLAGSYFCGYFVSQAIIPYTILIHGTVAAGQVGLMLSVFNALAVLIASYMYAAGPRYATMIARHESASLASTYTRVTVITLIAAVVTYIAVLMSVYGIHHFNFSIAERIASMSVVCFMAVIGVTNAYVGSAATLLRAQKKEPMLLVSIVVALGYALAMAALQNVSIDVLFMIFAFINLGLAVPLTVSIIRKSGLIKHLEVSS